MNYQTIGEIYAANDRVREKLIETVRNLTAEQASFLPEGQKWTIAQIVEHLSMVEDGTSRICKRLLTGAQAAGRRSEGTVKISLVIAEKSAELKNLKVEAPERVQPTSGKTIEESLEKMQENRVRFEEMRAALENFDLSEHKFPHPFFGDLTAPEWLVVMGGHEARHIKQIEKLIGK